MKKKIIAVIFLILALLIFLYRNIKIKEKQDGVLFENTNFYKNSYNTEQILFVDVWSIGSGSLVKQNPDLLKQLKNITYISFCTNPNLKKIKKEILKNSFLLNHDLTTIDFYGLDNIFEKIEFRKNKASQIVNFKTDVTPYYVIIKNKKIYYKSNEISSNIINSILIKLSEK